MSRTDDGRAGERTGWFSGGVFRSWRSNCMLSVGTEQCTSNLTNCVDCALTQHDIYTTWTDSAYDGEGRNEKRSPLPTLPFSFFTRYQLAVGFHRMLVTRGPRIASETNESKLYCSFLSFLYFITIFAIRRLEKNLPFLRATRSFVKPSKQYTRQTAVSNWHYDHATYTCTLHTHTHTHRARARARKHATLINYTFTGHI